MSSVLTFLSELDNETKGSDVRLRRLVARSLSSLSPAENTAGEDTTMSTELPTTAAAAAATNITTKPIITNSTMSTTNITAVIVPDEGTHKIVLAVGVTVSVLIAIVLVVGIVVLARKMGLMKGLFAPAMKRRSSTSSSSRRPLESDFHNEDGSHMPDGSPGEDPDEDMFTIDDMEEDDEFSMDRIRQDQEGYIYDEVYGPSQFQDEATKYSVRQLVNEDGHEDPIGGNHGDDEMLDFDFETLGIKITDRVDLSRQHPHA